ncbi:MAG: class I SAM-dependent methyltransferase [Prevotellaceae bacterium]|jgi:hypothetical protein|nr:class I SAM-dependent methyltransferase [Prevotellaceae bacterium]
MTRDIQVEKEHYDFSKYVNLPRWNSYWHQIAETMVLKPQTVLVIGIGDNIVGEMLIKQGIKVYTFDFDSALKPDFVGDIRNIDTILDGKRFDVILCCQLLEHLPYENFENILSRLKTLADNVIISLPHVCPQLKTALKLRLAFFAFCRKYKFNGEHYWEIGYRGYTKRKIRNSIRKYFMIKKEFLAQHNNYHLFFVLK